MPGAITAGNDPTQRTPHPFSLIGADFAGLADRTEPNVRVALEEDVKNRDATKGNSDLVFSGLNPALGMPAAIIKAALQAIIGVPLNIVSGGLSAVLGAFGGIPASQIQDKATENLVANPQFNVDLGGWTSSDNGAIPPVPHFTQDSSEGRSSQGSAKVVADGTAKTLRSTRIPVLQNNTITISAWRKLSAGTGVATPVRVNVRYLSAVGTVLATSNVGATTGTGTDDWEEITGPTITIDSNTKFIEVELQITATMTAGTVWWDDVSVTKQGKIPQNFVEGLVEALAETVQSLVDAFFGIPGKTAEAFAGFLKLLGNFFPALVPRNDGTATETDMTQQTDRNDGTAIITGGLGALMQVVDNTVQAVGDVVQNFLGIFGIHQGTLDAVTRGLTGQVGSTRMATVNDVQNAAYDAAQMLADNTASILALQQANQGANAVVSVDFTTFANANSLGAAGFNQIYWGSNTPSYLGIINARAAWYANPGGFQNERWCWAIKNTHEATGDDVLVGAAYSTKPENMCHDVIIARGNLAGDTAVVADFTDGRLKLSCWVSDVETVFTSMAYSKKASAAYYLKCQGRTFTVYENSTPILIYTEPGTTSQMGASYRRAGFGGMATTSVAYWWVSIPLEPGRVSAFSITDVV